jgi:flagellar protein FliO/FliZ
MTMIYLAGLIAALTAAGWFGWYYFGASGVAFFGGQQDTRIGLSEVVSIDGKRRLLLIYRDGVEHLVMTGGPIDVVIEQGIVLGPAAQAQPQRRSGAASAAATTSAPEPRLTPQPAVHVTAPEQESDAQVGFGRLRQRVGGTQHPDTQQGRADLAVRAATGSGR